MDQFTENYYLNWLLALMVFRKKPAIKILTAPSSTGWRILMRNALFLFQQAHLETSEANATMTVASVTFNQHSEGSRLENQMVQVCFAVSLQRDGTAVTPPVCLCVISAQTTLNPICREALSGCLRKGHKNQSTAFCWQCKSLVMTQQPPPPPGGVTSSCQDAREWIWDGGGGAGGGRPLQVWANLTSGYGDDKICGAGNLTEVFRRRCGTCLYTALLRSSLTTNIIASSGHPASACHGPNRQGRGHPWRDFTSQKTCRSYS